MSAAASPNESNLSILRNSLKQVERDLQILGDGMKKAAADRDIADALYNKLLRKLPVIQDQKTRLEVEVQKEESIERLRRNQAKLDTENAAMRAEERAAFQAGVEWEKKNGMAPFSQMGPVKSNARR